MKLIDKRIYDPDWIDLSRECPAAGLDDMAVLMSVSLRDSVRARLRPTGAGELSALRGLLRDFGGFVDASRTLPGRFQSFISAGPGMHSAISVSVTCSAAAWLLDL